MANIKVNVDFTIRDGCDIVFKAPCDASAVTGLIVHYPDQDGKTTSQTFTFKDAHGNNLANINNLFTSGAMVKIVLDTVNSGVYIQNADTNAYLENRFNTHIHDASAIKSGILSIHNGGTNAENTTDARVNLGFTYGTEVPTKTPDTGDGSVYFMEDDGEPLSIPDGGTGGRTVAEILKNLGIADYVVERGTKNNWDYIKWNSGKCNLIGKFSQTQTAYARNSWVVGSAAITGYPFPITNPKAVATGRKIGTGIGLINYDYERTDYWSGIMISPDQNYAEGTSMNCEWYVYVIADWK